MKRLTTLTLLSLSLLIISTSCKKDPDMDKLDNDYLVETNYKQGTDFASKSTYFINDTVYVIGGNGDQKIQKWDYETNANAKAIINTIKDNMSAKGYKNQTDTVGVDLGIQVTYFENLEYFTQFYNYWWDYWDYWGGGWYWDYYPYYPYPVYPITYSYQVGSLEIDMIDNKAKPVTINNKKIVKPVIWNSYATGLNSGNEQFDQKLIVQSINKSFAQSPYLQHKK